MKTVTLLALSAAVVITTVVVALQRHVPAQQPPAQHCTTDIPCLALQAASGQTLATFNDFRYEPGNCIIYRMTTSDAWNRYCEKGAYLSWIGPDVKPVGVLER